MESYLNVAHWPWYYVAVYFFLGGVSAAAYLIAAIADIFGDRLDRPLVRIGHYVALAAIVLCPILLILDLGRPLLFWRMLTRFKLQSPVSLGSWALFFFGLFPTVSALIWMAEDGMFKREPLNRVERLGNLLLRLPRKLIAVVGAFFGMFVAGYTGVLLSSTAIPFWSSNQLLGISFLTSAVSSALAVLAIVLLWRGYGEVITRRNFRDLWLIVLGFELFLVAWELFHEGGNVLLTGQFLLTFVVGVAVVGVLIPLAMLAWHVGKSMSTRTVLAVSVMVLIGAFLFRYSVLLAGQESVAGIISRLLNLM